MRKRKIFIAIHFIVIIVLASHNSMVNDAVYGASNWNFQSRTTVEGDSTRVQDGPYVFYIVDRVIVQYVCQGKIVTKEYEAGTKIQIPYSCLDTVKTYEISTLPSWPLPDTYGGVKKVIAISDIHGEFDQMIKLLQGNGVIDAQHHWNWGEGHLVIVGDIFDRGDQVTETFWFVHQLEREARIDGGWVHFILGNHESMVLRGDLRYVHEKYRNTAEMLRIRGDDLFGPETEIGRWLRTKHTIIKINDILFVHGGLSPELVRQDLSIPQVNYFIREGLDARDYSIRFDEKLSLLFGSNGPLWYRGYFNGQTTGPVVTLAEVGATLDLYGAQAIVVGHTDVLELSMLYEGRVFAIETGLRRGAEGEALVWEEGVFYRADVNGKRVILKKNKEN